MMWWGRKPAPEPAPAPEPTFDFTPYAAEVLEEERAKFRNPGLEEKTLLVPVTLDEVIYRTVTNRTKSYTIDVGPGWYTSMTTTDGDVSPMMPIKMSDVGQIVITPSWRVSSGPEYRAARDAARLADEAAAS